MYNLDKRRKSYTLKVKDVIKELEKENPEAEFVCCGDNYVTMHVEQDESVVCIDCESLDDAYEEDCDGSEEALYKIPDIEPCDNYVSRQRLLELLRNVTETLYENASKEIRDYELSKLGFTEQELKLLTKED